MSTRRRTAPRTTTVRLYRIAAGPAVEAVRTDEEVEVPAGMAQGGPPLAECYALQILGDSMVGDDIQDGDVVLVRRRESYPANPRAIYVVRQVSRNEVALKRVRRRGEAVRLISSRPGATEQLVPAADAEIQGEYVATIRKARGR